MSDNIAKYLYKEMDKQAGIEHTFHRTKIVATVGPSCDTYDKLLELHDTHLLLHAENIVLQ